MSARPLPVRRGQRPTTTETNPHTQLDQQPEGSEQRDRLAADLFALPGVEERASLISVPGARALPDAETWTVRINTLAPDDARAMFEL